MTHTWNRPLFAAVAIALFATWALLPPEGAAPREGRVLVYMVLQDVGPGETHQRDFRVEDFYTTMELSYNITEAAHVRVAVTGPDGARHDSVVHPVRDEITLVVTEPDLGDWRFEVSTLESPEQGHVLHANFTMLGFGGTLRLT